MWCSYYVYLVFLTTVVIHTGTFHGYWVYPTLHSIHHSYYGTNTIHYTTLIIARIEGSVRTLTDTVIEYCVPSEL